MNISVDKFYLVCGVYDKYTHKLLETTLLNDISEMNEIKSNTFNPDKLNIKKYDNDSIDLLFKFKSRYTIDELKKLISSLLTKIDNLYDMEYPLIKDGVVIELASIDQLDDDMMYKKYFEKNHLIDLILLYDILSYNETYIDIKLPEFYSPNTNIEFTKEYHDTFIKNLKNAINLLVKHGFITQNKEIVNNGNF